MTNFETSILYISVFLSSMFFMRHYQKKYSYLKTKGKNINKLDELIIIACTIILPVFISSIRDGVGTDYEGYWWHYFHFSDVSLTNILRENPEPLAYILHPIAKLLFGNVWGYFLISSLIIMVFIIKAIIYYKDRMSMPLSIFIYYMLFWSFSLNGIRQMMAMAIIVYAYRYIVERKFLKYLVFVVMAGNFHVSAFVCVLFYFLNIKPGNFTIVKRIIYYMSIIFSPAIIIYVVKFALHISIFSKYANAYSLGLNEGGIGFLVWILPGIIPLLYYRKRLVLVDNRLDCLINICLIQIPFHYIGYYVPFGGRISLYCLVAQVILIPLIINSIRHKKERIVVTMYFIIWYLVYFIVQSYMWNYSEAFPYQSILNLFN